MAPVALGSAAPIGSRLRLLGWGLDCANPNGCGRELPRFLNEVEVTAISAESCAPGRGESGTESCHDSPAGADACTFDSGEPALIGSPGNWAVVGTASRDGAGPDCGDGAGIHTDATAYRDWIRATMASRPAA